MKNKGALLKLGKLAYRAVKGKITDDYKPFFLSHLITSTCNFSCPGCLWNNPSGDLSTDEIRDLYQQAGRNGFLGNYIWGGEPLIRRDVTEIVQASSEQGFLTVVNTNGWFLEKKIDQLSPYVDVFVVSLDGAREETHDRLRKKGSYQRIVEGIKAVKRSGVPIIVNSIVLRDNKDEIDEMMQLWDKLGVVGYMNFMERGLLTSEGFEESKTAQDISEEERRDLAADLLLYKQIGAPLLNTEDYFKRFLNGKKPYACHFPKIFIEIYANGDVIDCLRVDKPLGNVREKLLEDILKHPGIKEMIRDGERCCVHNNADRIDTSNAWNLNPEILRTLVQIIQNQRR